MFKLSDHDEDLKEIETDSLADPQHETETSDIKLRNEIAPEVPAGAAASSAEITEEAETRIQTHQKRGKTCTAACCRQRGQDPARTNRTDLRSVHAFLCGSARSAAPVFSFKRVQPVCHTCKEIQCLQFRIQPDVARRRTNRR